MNKFPKAFIQMGSSVEYGNLKSPQKENRNCKVKFIKSIYGKAKLMATNHLIDLHKKKKISFYNFKTLSCLRSKNGHQSVYTNYYKGLFKKFNVL